MHTEALSGSIASAAAIDDDDDTVAVPRPASLAWNSCRASRRLTCWSSAAAGAYALASVASAHVSRAAPVSRAAESPRA